VGRILWHCDDFCFPEVVQDSGCHSTEFRLTCRELEQQIVILDAFFADSIDCTSAVGGAGTAPFTTTPSFFMVDDNETSTALARDIREAAVEKKQIGQPLKHRYVADWLVYTDLCYGVIEIFVACFITA
jgi:hypothetical protein